MCVRLREDEVLDTLVQRQRDGRAAPRMIHKLFKKQGRRRNRKFADSPLEERVSCELVSEAPAGRSSRQPRGWGPQEKRVNGSFWTI
jgi:transposase-like protein